MSIVVTPIPRLIDLAAPAFTLGTANAAGSAVTAVASDSTLLAFDTTLPAATGTSAVGTATTAPRRDHVHRVATSTLAGVAKAWSVYDNDGTFESLLTYNVALTDTAVGRCAHAFGTDFSTANWSAAGSSDENASFRKQTVTDASVDAQFRTTAAQALVDSNHCSVIFLGDQ
jgi:hypothetical protein